MNKSSLLKNLLFIILVVIFLGTIIFAYSNHFSNSFHFDDSHTIENNSAIRELSVTKYFTDGSTFSSLPSNQSYRPLTTLENAIDYSIAGGLHTKAFHIHIFLTFLIVCLLIWVFIKKILDKYYFDENNKYWALLVASIFGLLCANAETVNYIIQRAEITAGLFVLLGFVTYLQGGFWRTKFIYLVFPFIGFFAKEMAFVFAPLLLLYLLVFEEEVDLLHFYRKSEFKKTLKSFYKALPAIVLTVSFYVFYTTMLPSTFAPGGTSQYEYLITQPMVMVHYMVTFIIPYNLSADTDWTVYTTIFDYRALTGIFIIAGLFYLALKASKNKETRLFSFGILWFFISLLPTSSFIPFSEVLNDHRCFIPYIGLTISFVFGINYLLQKFLYKFYNKQTFKYIIYLGIFVFLTANVYGVRQRNKVWSTELSLWKDVTIKSPMNGRGLMNYGLSLMAKGDFVNAENYFNKSLLLNPNYGILHINLGVVKNAIGNKTEAENHFKKAIILNPNGHTHLYFYSHFLYSEGRLKEAKPLLNRALEISPTYSDAKSLLNTIKINETQNDVPNEINKKIISNAYLNLSLEHYNSGDFLACIEAAQKSNEIIPNCGAFNNICSAYNQLEEYDKAILACNEALKIDNDNNLAKGNLNVAISNSRYK